MSQTIPRNPVIPNGPGDLRSRFPSQPNPYNIPTYPAPPPRPYVPQAGGSPPSPNPFANRNGVALPGVPKTPGGNYVGPPYRAPYTYPGSRPHPGNWQAPKRTWFPQEPLWRPGQPIQTTPKYDFNWNLNTRSRPPLPAIPRSPGLNPRWPRWARIPPRMRIPALFGVGGAGLAILRPSPIDLLFGIIPDAMEASRPWVWQQLGIKDPNAATEPREGMGRCAAQYRIYLSVPAFRGGQEFLGVGNIMGPIGPVYTGGGSPYPEYFFNSGQGPISLGSGEVYQQGVTITRVERQDGLPDNCVGTEGPFPDENPGSPVIGANPLNPTNGVQPGTPPYSGMPAASPGRPATDPRGWRPDLANPPQTSPQPQTGPQPQPEPQQPEQGTTNCRFNPAGQAEIDGLRAQIRALEEAIRRLQEQLQQANQATYYQVPYVVEDADGKRTKQSYPLILKGLIDTTSTHALSNQTADWAMAKGDKTEKIYQILGGDQTWGNQAQPRAEINLDAQLRAQPVISEQGLGQMMRFANLPQLLTATQAVSYQRQGLQQFPITAQAPKLTGAGLLPDQTAPQVFNTATDVQMTTSSRGWAIVKGVNEVIAKTKQTIEWLKIDRILNLLTLATTLHNALMLSNALGQTLLGIIDNILATFGFALKDATGNTIGVGDLVGGTVENLIKAVVGADNYTNLKKEWAKANRIYQAGMNVIYSVQSIGHSILGALEVVGKWVAWIGNALKRFGALTEKAYPWMNPSPNFQNPIFTKIEAAQEMAEALEVVSSETRSVTETVSELGNQKKALEDSLKDGKDKPGVSNVEQQQNQDKLRAASQAPIIPKFDLVRPEPENR